MVFSNINWSKTRTKLSVIVRNSAKTDYGDDLWTVYKKKYLEYETEDGNRRKVWKLKFLLFMQLRKKLYLCLNSI